MEYKSPLVSLLATAENEGMSILLLYESIIDICK